MFELIPKTNINFVKKRNIFFSISGLIFIAGLASLLLKGGPKWGLDFTGGSLVEIKFQTSPAIDDIRKALINQQITSFEIQSVLTQNVFIIRTQLQKTGTNHDEGKQIHQILLEAFPDQNVTLLRKEFVGPTVGKHLAKETIIAFLLTFVGIIIYVAFRFHSGIWGASGVIALIHDVFLTIGLFSIFNKEISVTIVAALLTIAGYSINDTIVVFDFMRERLKFRKTESLEELVNKSLNETLSRTIITNLTVFLVVLTLFFFGGDMIHDFALAMIFGAIVGTYSSIGIAAPLIYVWETRQTQKNNLKK